MSRTDDDSWDITEGVGATALTVARARALESEADCPLYTDPYAHFFIEAATDAGWRPPFTEESLAHIGKADDQVIARMKTMAAYIASRTKYIDEFFTTAGANGLDQVVILAAGLDTRAWRLPWISGTCVYELDQPKVLEFKEQVLAGHNARPATRYVAVPVDLRQDWPAALRHKGFDPSTSHRMVGGGTASVSASRRRRTCCSSASTSSAPTAAGSPSKPSAPTFFSAEADRATAHAHGAGPPGGRRGRTRRAARHCCAVVLRAASRRRAVADRPGLGGRRPSTPRC